jgi:protein arginine kinase
MDNKLSFLVRQPVSWLSSGGNDDDIVISSRIRLARNLKGIPFPSMEDQENLHTVQGLCLKALAETEAIADPLDLNYQELNTLDRQLLLERRLISREFLSCSRETALAAEKDESVSIMINEEDHLRIQSFASGFRLAEIWEKVNSLDDRLSSRMEFAFDPEFGYLTACPSNLGTGMRASVMMHLPGLALSEKLETVMQGISKLGMTVRGFYGESSPNTGNLYQISNQSSLGESEEQIIFRLNALVRQIIRHEKDARNYFLSRKRDFLLNHAGRAYGILRYGYQISSREALDSLSALRLGADLGMFSSVKLNDINNLFLLVQPAHLMYHAGRELGKEERDSLRAKIIRETLKDLRDKL